MRFLILNVLPGEKLKFIVFGKENIVSYLLNETVRCRINDASLRNVAIDYFMHDSDGVFLALLPTCPTLKSDGST